MKNQILLGDCRDVLKTLPEQSVDLIFMSPPYANQRKKCYGGIAPSDYVSWFAPISLELFRVLKPTGTFILNIKESVVCGERSTYVIELILAMRKQGWLWTEEFIWHKKNSCPGKWPNRFRDAWERLLQFNKCKRFKMFQDAVMIPRGNWASSRLRNLCIIDRHRTSSQVGSGFGRNISRWLDRDKVYPTNVLQLVNTDPPYGVGVEPRSNNAIAAGLTSFSRREDLQCERSTSERGKKDQERIGKTTDKPRKMRAKDRPLTNDFLTDDEFEKKLNSWFANISRVLEPGRCAYIWGGYANLANYPSALKNNGLYFSQCLIWDKEHPVLTRKDFMGAFEICFYSWKEGAGHKFFGPNNVSDLWHVKKINPASMIHLTEKPVELVVRAIQYSSKPGENVLELFGGSGSTLMACEQTNRKCFAMEIDEQYADVIVRRWMEFTGKEAICVSKDGTKTPWSKLQKEENNE